MCARRSRAAALRVMRLVVVVVIIIVVVVIVVVAILHLEKHGERVSKTLLDAIYRV